MPNVSRTFSKYLGINDDNCGHHHGDDGRNRSLLKNGGFSGPRNILNIILHLAVWYFFFYPRLWIRIDSIRIRIWIQHFSSIRIHKGKFEDKFFF
jgi:hypothetical protein